MKVFMIRHGQTEANAEKWYAGQSDVKLTEAGKQQAREIAPILAGAPFDRVYSSDLSRAILTQQLALPGYTATPLPILREYDIGSITGIKAEEALQKYNLWDSNFTPFGGEDTEAVVRRAQEFLSMLEADPADRVAVFTHNGFMKCVLRLILDGCNTVPVENGNCNIAVFEYKNNAWHLLCWNYGAKL